MGSTSKYKKATFDNLSMLKDPKKIPENQNVNLREIVKNPRMLNEDFEEDEEK